MIPRFREDKATDAALLLIQLAGGEMNYMMMIKLLYLIDREALKRWGQPVTFDEYVSMDHGPVLSRTLDLINEGTRPGRGSYWHEHISAPKEYVITALKPSDAGSLSDAEIELVSEVHHEYGHIPKWELVDMLHKMLPEWADPQGSCAPISHADILTAVGKDAEQVQRIRGELDLIAYVDGRLSQTAV